MFVDARQIGDGSEIDCDFCIVGAGAAGLTIAREFANSGRSVCLLESGGLDYDEDTQALCQGEAIGHEYHPIEAARLRYFGGTTNHWGGICSAMRPIDFEARSGLPHSGWPITLKDVLPYYGEAQRRCQIDVVPFDSRGKWPVPPPPAVQGLAEDIISTQFFQKSPPTRFGETYRKDIEQAKNVRCLLFANLLEFVPADVPNRIETASVATLSGKRFSLRAKNYVLACGGIENPRLLLNSRRKTPRGLANDHDLVGRYFMEHMQFWHTARLVPTPLADSLPMRLPDLDARNVLALMLSPQAQRRHGGIAMQFYGEPERSVAEESWGEILRAVKRGRLPDSFAHHVVTLIENSRITIRQVLDTVPGGQALQGFAPALRKPRAMVIMAEQSPNPDSRVVLADQRDRLGQQRLALDWQVNHQDFVDVRRGLELFGAEMRRLKLGALQIMIDPDFEPSIEFIGAWHHMGTTRMSSDPKRGVVDGNCRVHGLGNLYIAGSSVFTTGSFVNPTLTIVALALRLADHLMDKRV